jgi:hypothetical protein
MSYEGFEEYLCKKGHYFTQDCMDDSPSDCPYCFSPAVHYHAVDCTNGIEEDNPGTQMAPKVADGHWDRPMIDVLGNKYVQRINIWRPTDQWRKVVQCIPEKIT